MPATRATARTSPWVMAPEAILAAVSGAMWTRQRATARRWLGSLAVTSTIRARPRGSRWVNSDAVTAAQCTGPAAVTGRSGLLHDRVPNPIGDPHDPVGQLDEEPVPQGLGPHAAKVVVGEDARHRLAVEV